MPNLLTPAWGMWWELLAILGVGSAATVLLAGLVSSWLRSAVWQRAVWQAGTLALFALLAMELTGLGTAGTRLSVAVLVFATKGAERANLELPTRGADPVSSQEEVASHFEGLGPVRETTGAAQLNSDAAATVWWPGLAWGLISCAILGRMVWNRALLAAFQRRCQPLRDATLGTRVQSIAAQLGIRRPVRVVTSASLNSPAVFHWCFPVLALPSRFADDFNEEQQQVVLAHELSHLARRDPAWQGAATLLCALLWWQPLTWWARRPLRAASEAAADEASLLVPDGPCLLAASLVSLARRLADRRRVGLVSIQGSGLQSELGRRVERLLTLENGGGRAPGRLRLALVQSALPIGFALVAMFCTAWAPSRHSFEEGETTMSVVTNSWRGSLAATALWATLGPGAVLQADEPSEKPAASKAVDGLEQKLKDIQAKAEELQKLGRKEEAAKLLQHAEELARRLKDVGGGGSDVLDEVQQKLKAIRAEAEQLQQQGRKEEAQKLIQYAEDMARKLKRQKGPKESYTEEDYLLKVKEKDAPDKLQAELRAIRERAEQLLKEGKKDEVEKLRQYAEDIARKLKSGKEPESADGLKQKLQAVREEAERLLKEGRKEEAEKLRQLAEDMVRTFKGGKGPEGADGLQEKLQDLRRLAELSLKEGKRDEAAKLMQHAEELARKFKSGKEPEGADGWKQKLLAIREEAQRLQKEGRKDEAEKLRKYAEEIARNFNFKGETDPEGPVGPEDVRHKLEELKRRIELLQADGRKEEAEIIRREAQEMVRKYRAKEEPKTPDLPEYVRKFKQKGSPEDTASPEDLRRELQQVRKELQETRDLLRQVLDQQRGRGEKK